MNNLATVHQDAMQYILDDQKLVVNEVNISANVDLTNILFSFMNDLCSLAGAKLE